MQKTYSSEVARNIPPTRTPSEMDIAWMAGIYEGEGHASGIKGRTIAHITQKDPEILFKIREMFGGSITEVRKGTPHYCHMWKLYGDVARSMFKLIYPFMSTRRKMQIEKAGGLRFTGAVCYREMKISDERKAKREGMTVKERQTESILFYQAKNSEKIKAYQRQYMTNKRAMRKTELVAQCQTIQ